MLELAKTYDFTIGDKPSQTAIFIHGLAADSSHYDALFEFFKNSNAPQNTRIVAFDLLGSGKSYASDDLEYNYDEQLTALKNSIGKLNLDTPITLVGHSMGTFIATRYAAKYPEEVEKLILISAPVYTPENLADPAFAVAMEGFKKSVAEGNQEIIKSKVFNNEIKNIVMALDNYDTLAHINQKTTIIYGDKDQIIAAFNLPALIKQNPCISVVETPGGHGISSKKFSSILDALK